MVFTCDFGICLKGNVVIDFALFVVAAFGNGIGISFNLNVAGVFAVFIAKLNLKSIKNNITESVLKTHVMLGEKSEKNGEDYLGND